jgi:site-specific recombinase XerD
MRIWPQLPWPPCSEVRGFQVFDPQKVRRPKIPKHEVEYLTKEEVQRFFNAIPTHTQAGLRDRALAEVLCITGMRIAEALSLNRAQIDWETRTAHIFGKGNKPRKVISRSRLSSGSSSICKFGMMTIQHSSSHKGKSQYG